jgi:hypothetical protein
MNALWCVFCLTWMGCRLHHQNNHVVEEVYATQKMTNKEAIKTGEDPP